jgi:hypothetical protein
VIPGSERYGGYSNQDQRPPAGTRSGGSPRARRARAVRLLGVAAVPWWALLGNVVIICKNPPSAIINHLSTRHTRFQVRKPCTPAMAKTTPTPKQTPTLPLEAPRMKNSTTAGAMMNNDQYETLASR